MRIAINGFGRIGRLTFRKIFGDRDMEVVAVNDLTKPEMLAYLLKYDSVQGGYSGHEVSHGEGELIVDGKTIKIYSEQDPARLPWKEDRIDMVIEATGFLLQRKRHLPISRPVRKKSLYRPRREKM